MNASVLVYCENSENYIQSFYQSILAQKTPPAELIFIVQNSTDSTRKMIRDLQQDVKCSMQLIELKKEVKPFQVYNEALSICTGDAVLFARPKHPFQPKKIEQFLRYFEDDVYRRFAFHNLELINENNEVVLPDYFGLSGFYERWDYYKDLSKVMAKQIGFVKDIQFGITKKTVGKYFKFLEEYPTFETKLNFAELMSTFIAIRYFDTVKEIPYVLNQYRPSVEEAEMIFTNKRNLNYSKTDYLQWLNQYKNAVILLDKEHEILPFIQKAIDFHTTRKEKQGLGFALGNLLSGNYRNYSFEAMNLFHQDRKG